MREINDKKPRPKAWARPLADLVAPCIHPAMAKYGFGEADIITSWSAIVGERVAGYARPLRLKWPRRPKGGGEAGPPPAATLVVAVDGGGGLELQHMAGTVIERINTHLGWRCVGKLMLQNRPIEEVRPARIRPPAPSPRAIEAARREAAPIADEALREALVRLGARALGPRARAR